MTQLLSTIVQFLPFIIVTWLANLADAQSDAARAQRLARLTYLLVALLYGGLLLVGLLLMVAGLLGPSLDLSFLLESYEELALDPVLLERTVAALPWIGVGLVVSSLLALLLLMAPVRRLVARVIPIDPHRTVHGVALSFTLLLVVNMVAVLGIGLGTLTELATARTEEIEVALQSPLIMLNLWAQQIMMALWALIGVGWLVRRTLPQALIRLGVVWPSLTDVLTGVGGGLTAVMVTALLSGFAANLGLGMDPDVQSLNEVLIGPLFGSFPGILTLGLAAALGEETIFRGALQPRFGIILTTLLFAITHSNYGLSLSTLFVFFAGLIFALLRHRYNTSTSMIAHATYNSTLGLLALLALRFLENSEI